MLHGFSKMKRARITATVRRTTADGEQPSYSPKKSTLDLERNDAWHSAIVTSANQAFCRCAGVAERKGFEPLIQLSPYGALAKRCLQPLGHLSGAGLINSNRPEGSNRKACAN